LDNKFVIDYSSMQTYTTWDKSKIQACVCDPYYEGTDCSLRQCPRGDNILTLNEISTVQQIQITHDDASTTGTAISGTFTITFTDLYGGVWTTRPISIGAAAANTAANIETGLKGLPNQVIEDIDCTAAGSVPAGEQGHSVQCTFTSDHNSGVQNLMKINYTGCTRAGCTPLYAGVSGASGDNIKTVSVTDVTAGNAHKEAKLCSEHGLCDTETGLCNCFSGYYDEDCSKQTVLV